MQIMQNLAGRNKKVVLVDCDLRKSVLLSHFSIRIRRADHRAGSALAGYCTLEEAVYATNIPGAYMIPAGKDIANPMPLLDSPEFTQLIEYLKQAFDVVCWTPLSGMVVDSAVDGCSCDGVILVVEHAKTPQGRGADAVKQINKSGCPVMGCIINRVSLKPGAGGTITRIITIPIPITPATTAEADMGTDTAGRRSRRIRRTERTQETGWTAVRRRRQALRPSVASQSRTVFFAPPQHTPEAAG